MELKAHETAITAALSDALLSLSAFTASVTLVRLRALISLAEGAHLGRELLLCRPEFRDGLVHSRFQHG